MAAKRSEASRGRPSDGRPFASPRLCARGLISGYRSGKKERALTGALDLDLRSGQLICLLGPNGAGKSTLLRTLAGIHPALGGNVELCDRPIDQWPPRQRARLLAVVLTEGGPPLGMSGLELVRLGRQPHSPWSGMLGERDDEVVRAAIEAVDGADLAPRLLGHLSDGERQKLLLARALAQEADILLLDEITAFLDIPRRLEIFRILRRLAHNQGKAVLLTTHDIDLALRSADRVWLISPEGFLSGAPESLVLDGSLGRAFAGRGIEFDASTGRFHLPIRQRGTVELHGDGLVASWTAHGLERLGFRVSGPGVAQTLESVDDGTGVDGDLPKLSIWAREGAYRLRAPGNGAREFEELEELFDAIVSSHRASDP